MALVPARANVLVSGIASWGISDTTASDTGYSLIPYLRNGKITITSLQTNNSYGQPVPYAYELAGSAEFPAMRTAANFLDLLNKLATDQIEHKITLINGQIISSKPGTSTPSPTGFGVKWRIVSDKDMDGDMFVEISISRRLTVAEYTQILTTANAPATGTSATFTNILSLTRADIVPAGIASVELGAASAGTYADDITNLQNGKFVAELLTTKDSRGQDMGFAIKVDFSVDSMETIEAELLKWPAITSRANECRITLINGLIYSFPAQLGITTQVVVDKDMDGINTLKISGSGIIKIADLNTYCGT
jgi:hypothetical protein